MKSPSPFIFDVFSLGSEAETTDPRSRLHPAQQVVVASSSPGQGRGLASRRSTPGQHPSHGGTNLSLSHSSNHSKSHVDSVAYGDWVVIGKKVGGNSSDDDESVNDNRDDDVDYDDDSGSGDTVASGDGGGTSDTLTNDIADTDSHDEHLLLTSQQSHHTLSSEPSSHGTTFNRSHETKSQHVAPGTNPSSNTPDTPGCADPTNHGSILSPAIGGAKDNGEDYVDEVMTYDQFTSPKAISSPVVKKREFGDAAKDSRFRPVDNPSKGVHDLSSSSYQEIEELAHEMSDDIVITGIATAVVLSHPERYGASLEVANDEHEQFSEYSPGGASSTDSHRHSDVDYEWDEYDYAQTGGNISAEDTVIENDVDYLQGLRAALSAQMSCEDPYKDREVKGELQFSVEEEEFLDHVEHHVPIRVRRPQNVHIPDDQCSDTLSVITEVTEPLGYLSDDNILYSSTDNLISEDALSITSSEAEITSIKIASPQTTSRDIGEWVDIDIVDDSSSQRLSDLDSSLDTTQFSGTESAQFSKVIAEVMTEMKNEPKQQELSIEQQKLNLVKSGQQPEAKATSGYLSADYLQRLRTSLLEVGDVSNKQISSAPNSPLTPRKSHKLSGLSRIAFKTSPSAEQDINFSAVFEKNKTYDSDDEELDLLLENNRDVFEVDSIDGRDVLVLKQTPQVKRSHSDTSDQKQAAMKIKVPPCPFVEPSDQQVSNVKINKEDSTAALKQDVINPIEVSVVETPPPEIKSKTVPDKTKEQPDMQSKKKVKSKLLKTRNDKEVDVTIKKSKPEQDKHIVEENESCKLFDQSVVLQNISENSEDDNSKTRIQILSGKSLDKDESPQNISKKTIIDDAIGTMNEAQVSDNGRVENEISNGLDTSGASFSHVVEANASPEVVQNISNHSVNTTTELYACNSITDPEYTNVQIDHVDRESQKNEPLINNTTDSSEGLSVDIVSTSYMPTKESTGKHDTSVKVSRDSTNEKVVNGEQIAHGDYNALIERDSESCSSTSGTEKVSPKLESKISVLGTHDISNKEEAEPVLSEATEIVVENKRDSSEMTDTPPSVRRGDCSYEEESEDTVSLDSMNRSSLRLRAHDFNKLLNKVKRTESSASESSMDSIDFSHTPPHLQDVIHAYMINASPVTEVDNSQQRPDEQTSRSLELSAVKIETLAQEPSTCDEVPASVDVTNLTFHNKQEVVIEETLHTNSDPSTTTASSYTDTSSTSKTFTADNTVTTSIALDSWFSDRKETSSPGDQKVDISPSTNHNNDNLNQSLPNLTSPDTLTQQNPQLPTPPDTKLAQTGNVPSHWLKFKPMCFSSLKCK